MTAEIPDLWDADIRVDVLSPLAILKIQAERLTQRTKGLLRARVYTTAEGSGDEPDDVHHLELFAPAINYTEQILTVENRSGRAYPAMLEMTTPISWESGDNKTPSRWCGNEAEFLKYLGTALKSSPVRSAIDSILALSNERNAPPTAPAA